MTATAAAAPHRPEGRWHRHVEIIWGTTVGIAVREGPGERLSKRTVKTTLDEAVAFMHRVDAVFSTYRPDSLVTALRSGALQERSLDKGDPDQRLVLEVIHRCREAVWLTDGCFDPWAVPGGFDPSGYVKGWAAQRIAENLVSAGCADVCVNAGGDVVTRGAAGTGQPWTVGIRHPDDHDALARTVQPGHGAVATSGVYERGNHILDPRTGEPATGARSATVVGPDAGLAEVLATALVVAGRHGAQWFDGLGDYSVFAIDPAPSATAWSLGRGPHLGTTPHLAPGHLGHVG